MCNGKLLPKVYVPPELPMFPVHIKKQLLLYLLPEYG